MRKVAALAAVMTISFGALTACSGSSGYCGALKDNKDSAKFDPNAPMADSIKKMKEVREKAPSDQKVHWDTMIAFMEKYEKAKGKPEQLAELGAESAKVGPASQAIAKYAKDECKVEIAGA